MLSLHAADVVEPGGGRPAVPGGAVLVDGASVAAIGALESLAAAHPTARVRRWGGTLRPGRAEPVGDDVAGASERADLRERGEAARRAAHSFLTRGVTSVLGLGDDPVVRGALARSGVREGAATPLEPGARAEFAVYAADGSCVVTVVGGRVLHRRR